MLDLPLEVSLRSSPAQKARPSPRRITTRTVRSKYRPWNTSRSSVVSCVFSALSCAGRFMITCNTSPVFSSRRAVKVWVIFISLRWAVYGLKRAAEGGVPALEQCGARGGGHSGLEALAGHVAGGPLRGIEPAGLHGRRRGRAACG